MRSISATELSQWLSSTDPDRNAPFLLDVRETWEFETCRLPNSTSIPMGQIQQRVDEIESDQPVVCICHHGARSMQVALFLESSGISTVLNLAGGLEAWAISVDPQFPRY